MAMAQELQGQEDERQPEADEANVENGLHVQHGDLGRLGDDAFDAQEAVGEPIPLPLVHQAGLHHPHHAETGHGKRAWAWEEAEIKILGCASPSFFSCSEHDDEAAPHPHPPPPPPPSPAPAHLLSALNRQTTCVVCVQTARDYKQNFKDVA